LRELARLAQLLRELAEQPRVGLLLQLVPQLLDARVRGGGRDGGGGDGGGHGLGDGGRSGRGRRGRGRRGRGRSGRGGGGGGRPRSYPTARVRGTCPRRREGSTAPRALRAVLAAPVSGPGPGGPSARPAPAARAG